MPHARHARIDEHGFHDHLCRCRHCKPSLDQIAAARAADVQKRLEVAAAIVGGLLFAMIVARVLLRI